MKSYIVFHKEDGTETPVMTLKEFEDKKYLDHGVTEEDIKKISDRFKRNLINDI